MCRVFVCLTVIRIMLGTVTPMRTHLPAHGPGPNGPTQPSTTADVVDAGLQDPQAQVSADQVTTTRVAASNLVTEIGDVNPPARHT